MSERACERPRLLVAERRKGLRGSSTQVIQELAVAGRGRGGGEAKRDCAAGSPKRDGQGEGSLVGRAGGAGKRLAGRERQRCRGALLGGARPRHLSDVAWEGKLNGGWRPERDLLGGIDVACDLEKGYLGHHPPPPAFPPPPPMWSSATAPAVPATTGSACQI